MSSPLPPRNIHTRHHIPSSTTQVTRLFRCQLGWRYGHKKVHDGIHCHAQQWRNCIEKPSPTYRRIIHDGVRIYGSHGCHERTNQDQESPHRTWSLKQIRRSHGSFFGQSRGYCTCKEPCITLLSETHRHSSPLCS